MKYTITEQELSNIRLYLAGAIWQLLSDPEESPIEFGYPGGWVAALPEGYTDEGEGYESVPIRIWRGVEGAGDRAPDAIVTAGGYLSTWLDPRDLETPCPFVVTFNGDDEQYGESDYELWSIDAAHDLSSWQAYRKSFTTITVKTRRHCGIVSTRHIYEYYSIGEDVSFIALRHTYKQRGLRPNASVDYIDTLQAAIEDMKESGETDLEPYQTRLNTLLKMAGRATE